jgi:hypothetical protein
MKKRAIAVGFGLVAVFLLASSARAQRGASMGFAPGGHSGPVALHPGGSNVVHSRRFGHGGHGRAFVAGYGFFPYFDSDLETENVEPPPPQVVFVPPAPAATTPTPASKPAESLLLERHGDTWLRVSSSGDARVVTGDRFTGTASGAATNPATHPSDAAAVVKIPPAVLVFRDGHTEQIRKYVITGNTLVTSGDYWSTGSWTRKIAIADLNIPETLQVNRERGTGFSLPSRPGEVMMRP